MGRPPEFDRDQALDAAMDVFWTRGFKAASLSELTEAMKLSKSSFYQSFGNKQDVLSAALDWYTEQQARRMEKAFRGARLRSALERFFAEIARDNDGGRGCLLGNCAVELGPHDSAVAAQVRQGLRGLIGVLEQRIRRAQEEGEIPATRSASDLANYLGASINGMRVLAKAGMDRPSLTATGNLVLDTLFRD